MKGPDRRRLLDAGACLAGVGVVLAVWIPRLPAAPDFILTRSTGDWLLLPLARVLESQAARAGAAWLALLFMGGSLLLPAAALWRSRRELFSRKETAVKWALFSLGAIALVICARWGVSSAVDVVENAWFAPESLQPAEPALLLLIAWGFAALLWRALGGWWDRVFFRKIERWTLALAVFAFFIDMMGRGLYDAGKRSLAEAARLPVPERRGRLVLIFKEEERRPAVERHEILLGVPEKTQYSSDSLAAVEGYASRRKTVFRRAALRYLYGGYTLQMDAGGLRRVLARGDRDGDVLARALLLDNLAVAPVDDAARSLFASVSDERRVRVGSSGAARLSAAAAHLGLSEEAARWERRAAAGPDAVAPGLLARAGAGEPLRGRVDVRLRGPREGLTLALYARPAEGGPYSLGPGQLVADARPGRDGRVRFSDLAAGDYFLAVAVDSQDEQPPHLRATGRWGGLRLSARRPRSEA